MNEQALQALLDKQDIAEVVGTRYARALDWLDIEKLRSCFHPDALVDYGFYVGPAEPWCDLIISRLKNSVHRFHYMFPPQIVIHGEQAVVESNSLAGSRTKTADNAEAQGFFGSRYFDTVEKRGGCWKLRNRVVRLDFLQSGPAPAYSPEALQGLSMLSNANTQHPLYAWK